MQKFAVDIHVQDMFLPKFLTIDTVIPYFWPNWQFQVEIPWAEFIASLRHEHVIEIVSPDI